MLDKTAGVTSIAETRRIVFVRGLTLDAHIGAYDHEQGVAQPVEISLELEIEPHAGDTADRFDEVVCYNRMTEGVRAIVAQGHVKLVETLAERIAAMALSNPMVRAATISVSKPRAIAEAAAAGVEIRRQKG